MDQSPHELVMQARGGDGAAFAELIDRYERSALSVAYGCVGDAATAADVTQEAFLRAWQRLSELKAPARFGAWLIRIVRNLAADHVRRRPFQQVQNLDVLDGLSPASADPSAELDRQEMRQRIAAALQSLDDLTRSAVVLRYYDDLPSRQIGELLELSPAAVDMRLSRARAVLREKLESAGLTDQR